jgi:chromosome segregation ATPase
LAKKSNNKKSFLTEILSRLETLKTDRDQALKYLELKNQKEVVERDLVFVRSADLEERCRIELREIEKLNKKEEEKIERLHQTEPTCSACVPKWVASIKKFREKGGNEQLFAAPGARELNEAN